MYKQLVRSEEKVRELRKALVVLKGQVLTKELLWKIAVDLDRDLQQRRTAILTSFAGLVDQVLDDRLLLKIAYQLAWYDRDLTAGRPAAMVLCPDQVEKAVVRILTKAPCRDGCVLTVIGAAGPLAGTPFKLFVPDQRSRWFQRAVGFSHRGTYRMQSEDSHVGLYVEISGIRHTQAGWVAGFDLSSNLMRRNRGILNARRHQCAMPDATEGLHCGKCKKTMKECDYALRWSHMGTASGPAHAAGGPGDPQPGGVQSGRSSAAGGGADSAGQHPTPVMPAYPGD